MDNFGIFARVGNLLIRSFAHRSFAHLLICSFAQIAKIKWATVSDSLRLLRTNEGLWANRSGHSCQKSDRERISKVAQDKWANKRIIRFFWANYSFALLLTKTSDSLKLFLTKIKFLKRFLSIFLNKQFAHSLFLMREWAMWANRSGRSPKMSDHVGFSQVSHQRWANERIACFLSKSIICSFFRKKRVICSENRWANFQPWFWLALSLTSVVIMDSFNIYSLYSFSLLSSSEQ